MVDTQLDKMYIFKKKKKNLSIEPGKNVINFCFNWRKINLKKFSMKRVDLYSAEIDSSRQKLTSVDLKSTLALQEKKYVDA